MWMWWFICLYTHRGASRNKHHPHPTKNVLSNSRKLRRFEEWSLMLIKIKLVSFNISKGWCSFLLSRDRFCSNTTRIFTLSFIDAHLQINLLCFYINCVNQLSSKWLHWLHLENLRINSYEKGDKNKRERIHWWICWDLSGKNEMLFQMSVSFLCRSTE